jgi:hypothetical protein
MKKTISLQIPKKEYEKACRLISDNDVIYFEEQTALLDYNLIDSLDLDIRLIAHVLSKTECLICSFFAGNSYSQDYLKNIWNNIKREEKSIKDEGINLLCQDGSSFFYKDENYRIRWPSFDSFCKEYSEESNASWLVIKVHKKYNNLISLLHNESSFNLPKFNITLIDSYEDYKVFSISFLVEDESIRKSYWRRITETIGNSIKDSSLVVKS